MIFGGEFLV